LTTELKLVWRLVLRKWENVALLLIHTLQFTTAYT
jgi:hypothetical protein